MQRGPNAEDIDIASLPAREIKIDNKDPDKENVTSPSTQAPERI